MSLPGKKLKIFPGKELHGWVLRSESSRHLGTYWLYFCYGESTHQKISWRWFHWQKNPELKFSWQLQSSLKCDSKTPLENETSWQRYGWAIRKNQVLELKFSSRSTFMFYKYLLVLSWFFQKNISSRTAFKWSRDIYPCISFIANFRYTSFLYNRYVGLLRGGVNQ